MKLLAWAILVFAVMWVLRNKARAAQQKMREQGAPPPLHRQPVLPEAEVMVACMKCGMHFPASEAVRNANGEVFCCDEHRLQHARTSA